MIIVQITNKYFTGERILYGLKDAKLEGVTFGKGESPLKEARNLEIKASLFTWKYPLWYDQHIKVDNTTFETMARSGIWYTDDIKISSSALQAPKLFRRCSQIDLEHVHFANAEETMWSCKQIRITDSTINGDYFGKDSQDIFLDHVSVIGNYVFDGAKNIEVHNSTFISKDAFWNCENVKIYDSVIDGEYLAWNTKNITLINCQITSSQGLNYIDNLTIKHSKILNSELLFEYCSRIDIEVDNALVSVKNPISGRIVAPEIETLILDQTKVDPDKTQVICNNILKRMDSSDLNQTPKVKEYEI